MSHVIMYKDKESDKGFYNDIQAVCFIMCFLYGTSESFDNMS